MAWSAGSRAWGRAAERLISTGPTNPLCQHGCPGRLVRSHGCERVAGHRSRFWFGRIRGVVTSPHRIAFASLRAWRQAPAWTRRPVQRPAPFEFRGDPRRGHAQELAGAGEAHGGLAGPKAAFRPAERRRKPSTTLKEKDVKRTWRGKWPFQRPPNGLAHLPKTCSPCRQL